jgi:hypothetical protein
MGYPHDLRNLHFDTATDGYSSASEANSPRKCRGGLSHGRWVSQWIYPIAVLSLRAHIVGVQKVNSSEYLPHLTQVD